MFFTLMLIAGGAGTLWSQTETQSGERPEGDRTEQEEEPVERPAAAALSAPTTEAVQLNLLGNANTAAGESRRNENIQFNLVDNNALKELECGAWG
ncbi:MAG: hypothetical protein U5J83_02030 [Bryobacterales bacterium]|nr:hypothetical protein [Bryobacterales bacterium]